MPPFFVIDDDGPARAARDALRRQAVDGLGTNGSACNAVIADPCMLGTDETSRALAAHDPAAQLIAISRDGAIASFHDTPDFPSMAGRLATK